MEGLASSYGSLRPPLVSGLALALVGNGSPLEQNKGAASDCAASQPRAGIGNCFYQSMHAARVSCARLVACRECHEGYCAAGAMQSWVWHWADASGEFPLPVRRRAYFPWRQRNPDSTWNRSLVAHMIHWPGHLRAGERVPRRRPEMHIPAVATRGAEARQILFIRIPERRP